MMINAIDEDNVYNYHHKVYRHVIDHFDSPLAAMLIARLEYWFSRDKFVSSFYKFLEPSKHRAYRPGDSWTEEMKMSRKNFNKLFDLIGTRYKSKSDYIAAQRQGDPFGGKLYLSYYDRSRNQMYYQRNHAYVRQVLGSLFKIKDKEQPQRQPLQIKPERVNVGVKSHDPKPNDNHDTMMPTPSAPSIQNAAAVTSLIEQPPEKSQQSRYRNGNLGRSIYIQINTNNSSSSRIKKATLVADSDKQKVGEEMKAIWLEEVGHCTLSKISQSLADRMANFLTSCLNSCLQAWRAYCRKIASSRFLMGEIKQTFKAWLPWVIKQPTFEKIESGEYTLGDRELKQTTGQQQDYEAQAEANVSSQLTEEAQTFHKHLLAQAGPLKYNYWFKDLQIVKTDQQTVYLKARMKFVETYINNNYESLVMSALMEVYSSAKKFTFTKFKIDNGFSI